jgi:hypothetical protein
MLLTVPCERDKLRAIALSLKLDSLCKRKMSNTRGKAILLRFGKTVCSFRLVSRKTFDQRSAATFA